MEEIHSHFFSVQELLYQYKYTSSGAILHVICLSEVVHQIFVLLGYFLILGKKLNMKIF